MVPVIVSVELPPGVFGVVVTLSVEVPDPVMDDGVSDAMVSAGKPLALKPTVPVNPFAAPMATV